MFQGSRRASQQRCPGGHSTRRVGQSPCSPLRLEICGIGHFSSKHPLPEELPRLKWDGFPCHKLDLGFPVIPIRLHRSVVLLKRHDVHLLTVDQDPQELGLIVNPAPHMPIDQLGKGGLHALEVLQPKRRVRNKREARYLAGKHSNVPAEWIGPHMGVPSPGSGWRSVWTLGKPHHLFVDRCQPISNCLRQWLCDSHATQPLTSRHKATQPAPAQSLQRHPAGQVGIHTC